RLRELEAGAEAFVADGDLVLVDAVLVAPAPVRPRAHVRPGGADLRHAEQPAWHLRALRVREARHLLHRLALVRRAVAVLAEERLPGARRRAEGDHRVAAAH